MPGVRAEGATHTTNPRQRSRRSDRTRHQYSPERRRTGTVSLSGHPVTGQILLPRLCDRLITIGKALGIGAARSGLDSAPLGAAVCPRSEAIPTRSSTKEPNHGDCTGCSFFYFMIKKPFSSIYYQRQVSILTLLSLHMIL